MSSQRFKLKENVNDSKNTRMDILAANVHASWKPDELAHISRYCKIAELVMEEAKRLGRPIDCFEVGCGYLWVLRTIYKAHVCVKKEQVREYVGYDIDPAVLRDLWSNKPVMETSLAEQFTARVVIQDLTVNPKFERSKQKDGKFDFFWTTEVIEHMGREFIEPWLADVAAKLRKGGLVYVSTPNHDGSNEKLPEDHVYEWRFGELRELLEKYFKLEYVSGVFTQRRWFDKGQKVAGASAVPQRIVDLINQRFDNHWARVVLGMFYPERANNCAWVARKK